MPPSAMASDSLVNNLFARTGLAIGVFVVLWRGVVCVAMGPVSCLVGADEKFRLLCAAATSLLSYQGYKRGALSHDGALAAIWVGLTCMLAPLRFGAVLLFFFGTCALACTYTSAVDVAWRDCGTGSLGFCHAVC